MGFFDKWTKKTEKEQLKAANKKTAGVSAKAKTAKKEPKSEDTTEEKTVKTVTTPKTKKTSGNAYQVIVRPIVSEKAGIAESNGVYSFVVNNKATKIDVKKAVFQVYGVKALKVRIVNVEGKNVRFGQNYGRRSDWKKALVTLSKGQSISIHEGV